MACSNCFNGCTEIISDQCVKYTGVNIPDLGIETGDTLAEVELKITEFILNLSIGEGIIPNIDPDDLCTLVSSFLPESGDITLNQVISALIRSVCDLEGRVENLENDFQTLNADYDVDCLGEEGVSPDSGTHDILQAAINKLCATDTALAALLLSLPLTYVKIDDLDERIQEYLDSIAPSNLQKNKMVPYVAYEYYGSLEGFDMTGIGSGQWENVYLCNGSNGTPDKRGRVAVGATTGMGGGPMNVNVNPGGGNPNYTLGFITGTNTVSLTEQQLPSHTHVATAAVVDNGHQHGYQTRVTNNRAQFSNTERECTVYQLSTLQTSTAMTGISVNVTNAQTGGGLGHSNIQPSIGAYYIMYIP